MAKTAELFSLKVIATNKVFYDGKARYLNVRTLDGEIAFMAKHAPIVVAVEVGTLDVQKDDGSWVHVEVGKGILQFANNRLTLLVDTLERPHLRHDMPSAKYCEHSGENHPDDHDRYQYRHNDRCDCLLLIDIHFPS